MDSRTASQSSSVAADALELDLPTSADDVLRLRQLKASAPTGLRHLNALSATRLFPHLQQRRSTSADQEPLAL